MRTSRFPRTLAISVAIAVGIVDLATCGDELPQVEDENLLSLLNCGKAEAPANWRPVAQWTFPGSFPNRLSLRAYHGVSFGGARSNVDYMVCHLLWYRTEQDAQSAFDFETERVAKSGSTHPEAFGSRTSLSEDEVLSVGQQPRQLRYRLLIQRGAFLFKAGIVSVAAWSDEKLRGLFESIESGLSSATAPPGRSDTGAGRIDDPRRPPSCNRTCPVHKEPLAPLKVRFSYGFPRIELPGPSRAQIHKDYSEAKATLFPAAPPESVGGGCMIDELLDGEWLCVCQTCKSLEAEWRNSHDYPPRSH